MDLAEHSLAAKDCDQMSRRSLVELGRVMELRRKCRNVLRALYDGFGTTSHPNLRIAVHWRRQRKGPRIHAVNDVETTDDLGWIWERSGQKSAHQEALIDLVEWVSCSVEMTS